MKKKCKVVALPSNHGPVGQFIDTKEYTSAQAMGWDVVTSYYYIQAHHLYIISDDEIKVGDYMYLEHAKYIIPRNKDMTDDMLPRENRNVIASTDSTLGVRAIPGWFIESWCRDRDAQIVVEYNNDEIIEISDLPRMFTEDQIEFVLMNVYPEYNKASGYDWVKQVMAKFDTVEEDMEEFEEDQRADAYKRELEDRNFYEGL